MKTLIFLLSIEAIVLALLKLPTLSSVISCLVVWVSIVVFLVIRIFRSNDQFETIFALLGMVAYSCFAIIPDSDNFSPRRKGPELTSNFLRRSYGPITGRGDLDIMPYPNTAVKSSSSARSNDLVEQNDPFANVDGNSASSVDFESLQDLINETLDLDPSDPSLEIFPHNVLPQNLSGLGPYLAFQDSLQMFMWIGHAFVSMLIALIVTIIGKVVKLLRSSRNCESDKAEQLCTRVLG